MFAHEDRIEIVQIEKELRSECQMTRQEQDLLLFGVADLLYASDLAERTLDLRRVIISRLRVGQHGRLCRAKSRDTRTQKNRLQSHDDHCERGSGTRKP